MLRGVVATGFSLWCQLPRHRLRLGVEIRSIAIPYSLARAGAPAQLVLSIDIKFVHRGERLPAGTHRESTSRHSS